MRAATVPRVEPERVRFKERAPGQPKSLGTDAFTASGSESESGFGCGGMRSLAAKSSEGVRSRQKNKAEASFCWMASGSHDRGLSKATSDGTATGSEILESY